MSTSFASMSCSFSDTTETEPWHRGIEPIEATSRRVEDQRRAGVEGIESAAMLCCVEDRALASSLASSPIEPGVEPIEPGVEPYRAWRRALSSP